MTTASIIIIGDEILSGKFQDLNTPWLIKRCTELDIQVQSVQIIPDDVERIASVVREESQRSRYVFTTGGVGPTHDDMTFLGVATAFDQKLKENERLASLIRTWFTNPSKDVFLMALIPEGAELLETTNKHFPQIVVENVYIFPGVPKLLQRKFNRLADLLEGRKIFRDKLGFMLLETDVASKIREIQNKNQDVSIGSYPRFDEEPSLILTVEGPDESRVLSVKDILKSEFIEYYFEN